MTSITTSPSKWSVGKAQLFSVTLRYKDNIPNFSGCVYALDEENAVVVCSHDATNKGWPKNFIHSTVSNIS